MVSGGSRVHQQPVQPNSIQHTQAGTVPKNDSFSMLQKDRAVVLGHCDGRGPECPIKINRTVQNDLFCFVTFDLKHKSKLIYESKVLS